MRTYDDYVSDYRCTAEHHDRLHAELTHTTWNDPLLARHRRHIEDGQLGFGDAAFHAMWRTLLLEAHRRFGQPRCLEIGVFKGQVVSLWSLLDRALSLQLDIHAISPLRGRPLPSRAILRRLRGLVSPRFREEMKSGNFYPAEDYERVIRSLFQTFDLDWTRIRLWRGLSTDRDILAGVPDRGYHVVYIDGDHTFEGVTADITHFAPRVEPGGWLVMDDAGADLPGTTFWKGHESVSRACAILPTLNFRNVLNVGHNRIFEKMTAPSL